MQPQEMWDQNRKKLLESKVRLFNNFCTNLTKGKTMKNLVILGCARAGKSYLSKQITKQLTIKGKVASLLPADVFLGSVHRHDCGILWRMGLRKIVHAVPWFERIHQKSLHKRFVDFSLYFMSIIEKDIVVVFEGTHIKPSEAIKIFSPDKYKIVIVGYPNISISEKIKDIKKYDVDSYLKNKTDDQLKSIIASNISESKRDFDFAQQHGLTYIDTSKDYQTTINNFAKNIYEFMSE